MRKKRKNRFISFIPEHYQIGIKIAKPIVLAIIQRNTKKRIITTKIFKDFGNHKTFLPKTCSANRIFQIIVEIRVQIVNLPAQIGLLICN